MKTRVPAARAADRGLPGGQDEAEFVTLVDVLDRPLGASGKLDVHRTGELHRAFSILIESPTGQRLLQRRAAGKYHFAGSWSNACCGHPRPGEAVSDAAARRLREELGIVVGLEKVTELTYRATDPLSGLTEHEYLHVYRGVFQGEPRPDPDEVGAWRWMSVDALRRAIRRHPESFTPWFRLLIARLLAEH